MLQAKSANRVKTFWNIGSWTAESPTQTISSALAPIVWMATPQSREGQASLMAAAHEQCPIAVTHVWKSHTHHSLSLQEIGSQDSRRHALTHDGMCMLSWAGSSQRPCLLMAHLMDVKPIDDELTFVYQVVPYLQGYKGTLNQAHQLSQGCSPHSQFHEEEFKHPPLVPQLATRELHSIISADRRETLGSVKHPVLCVPLKNLLIIYDLRKNPLTYKMV